MLMEQKDSTKIALLTHFYFWLRIAIWPFSVAFLSGRFPLYICAFCFCLVALFISLSPVSLHSLKWRTRRNPLNLRQKRFQINVREDCDGEMVGSCLLEALKSRCDGHLSGLISQHWTSPVFLWLTLREQLWTPQLHRGHVSLEDPELLIIL